MKKTFPNKSPNRILPFAAPKAAKGSRLTFIDLFCGIGGFHQAARDLGLDCLFASDIDADCRKAYHANYDVMPHGDIIEIDPEDIPDHDLLCAGFPCQPFSIIGRREGFEDARGTLFFYIAEIIAKKQPAMVMLENVKQLVTHDNGRTLNRILSSLHDLGYSAEFQVFNALNFGLPQKRERVVIVAYRSELHQFPWPNQPMPMTPLSSILESNPDPKHFVSQRIRKARLDKHTAKIRPAIWHENKGGNVASHPFSCALRAGASYNYLLVDGERRLTTREMLRLQGFPDTFKAVCNDSQTRKQAGNSVPVPMIKAVMEKLIDVHRQTSRERASA